MYKKHSQFIRALDFLYFMFRCKCYISKLIQIESCVTEYVWWSCPKIQRGGPFAIFRMFSCTSKSISIRLLIKRFCVANNLNWSLSSKSESDKNTYPDILGGQKNRNFIILKIRNMYHNHINNFFYQWSSMSQNWHCCHHDHQQEP